LCPWFFLSSGELSSFFAFNYDLWGASVLDFLFLLHGSSRSQKIFFLAGHRGLYLSLYSPDAHERKTFLFMAARFDAKQRFFLGIFFRFSAPTSALCSFQPSFFFFFFHHRFANRPSSAFFASVTLRAPLTRVLSFLPPDVCAGF